MMRKLSTTNYNVLYRDDKTKLMWEINTVHKILNWKGIYAILSRIWKCRKSRVLVLIFGVKKLAGANFLRFCNSATKIRDRDMKEDQWWGSRQRTLETTQDKGCHVTNRLSLRLVPRKPQRIVPRLPDQTGACVHFKNFQFYYSMNISLCSVS